MRDRPWSKDAPAGPWDTIVIGSGMDGDGDETQYDGQEPLRHWVVL